MVTLSVLSLIIALLLSGAAAFRLLSGGKLDLVAGALFFYFLSIVLAGNLISH